MYNQQYNYDSQSRGISYSAGFFMLIAFGFAGLIMAGLLSIPVWQWMTGTGFMELEREMSNPEHANAVRAIQLLSVLFGLLLPTVVTAALMNRRPLRLLGFSENPGGKRTVLVMGVMVASLFIAGSLGYLNQMIPVPESWEASFRKLEENYAAQVEVLAGLKNWKEYLFGLLIMAFLPAVCEEALFRGGLQNFLYRWTSNGWLAVITVSILFSLIHFSYYGFLPRLYLGIVLGLIFHYTGSLWLCIIAHFFNNAIAVTVLYYYTSQGKSIQEGMEQESPWYLGLIFLPLLIYLLRELKKTPARTDDQPSATNGI